ncbi:MAG: hypothetical protein V4541_06495 [Bacteroidota bacterium]
MLKYRLNLFYAFVFTALLFACSTTNNKPLLIRFSADSSTILISGIEPAGLLQLKNNINTDTTYQSLVTVLETPAENDSIGIEREWPGKLSMEGDKLIFKPDSPFIKGKDYLVETVINVSFANAEKVIKGNMKRSLKAQQEILHH